MSDTFKAVRISERVYWVGAIDNTIRDFHGYSTSRGTTYNAFLVLGSQPVLIDTVKEEFFDEMMARISSVIDPQKIKYIISNHAEMDHSGSLPALAELISPEQIFASSMGVVALNAHFHRALPLTEINSREELMLGDSQFVCIESRMLHWPDSMFTYLANDRILFSQDGFGMHLATHNLLADQNNAEVVRYEAMKYFANILLPYSSFVSRFLASISDLHLDIDLIAPDHGPVWHTPNNISRILGLWDRWSKQEVLQPKIVICYGTMWDSTAKMASAIADGLAAGGVEVKVMPLSVSHRSDVATELLEARGLLVGSPTLNGQLFPTVADTLCYLKGLKRKNLIGQAFGSFGWSGEAVGLIKHELNQMQVRLVGQAPSHRYVPDHPCLVKCRALGTQVSAALLEEPVEV